MTGTLPFIPGAVRAWLLQDSDFTSACGGRCSTTAPDDVSAPYAQVRVAGNYDIGQRNIGYRPMVEITGWSPADLSTQDPALATWNIAASAARAMESGRNVAWQSIHWSYRGLLTGPMPGEANTSRGPASALVRAFVLIELTVHNH
ncbi:hypothetical protein LCD36_04475 [Saccharopolyspora sp. 6T]|uniref:hypothetical protein n=1 Tax=Saccharopolyspora sp. 6T TaxID=2877238 RepID=UPI001CD267D9|nr:hypothetical protein [Saccharopolyspora sp. 6T]MCA1185707.1 hypothetical protein [Saccharopolyspora sp. 6T]